jgi:hypothetical protein
MKPDTRSPEEIKYYQTPWGQRLFQDLELVEGHILPAMAGGLTCVNCDPYTQSMMIRFNAGMGAFFESLYSYPSDLRQNSKIGIPYKELSYPDMFINRNLGRR